MYRIATFPSLPDVSSQLDNQVSELSFFLFQPPPRLPPPLTRYQKAWEALTLSSTGLIDATEIPWPGVSPTEAIDQITPQRLSLFFLDGAGGGGEGEGKGEGKLRRKLLQAEQRRWHPDKFVARWAGRLRGEEETAVLERVTRIAQCLNELRGEG